MTRLHADFSSSSLLSHLSHTSLFVERGDETEQAIDRVTSDFAQQLSPIHLVPLLGATAIGRFAQLGARVALQPSLGFWTPLFSTSFSLTVEAATFEGLSRQIHSTPISFSQGFTNSLITFSSLRTANFFGAPNLFLSHLFQDTAQVVSHSLCENLELTPRNHQSLWLQFLEAERSTLQIETSLRFFHHLFPLYQNFEHSLSLGLSSFSNRMHETSEPNDSSYLNAPFGFALETQGASASLSRPSSRQLEMQIVYSKGGNNSHRETILPKSSETVGKERGVLLREEFLERISSGHPQEQQLAGFIIDRVSRIELDSPEHHRYLLEALALSPHRGSTAQAHTVMVLKDVFETNALNYGTGGFEHYLIQTWVSDCLNLENPHLRNQRLNDLFEIMHRGSSRNNLYALFASISSRSYRLSSRRLYSQEFFDTHRHLIDSSWKNLRPESHPSLLNFIFSVHQTHPHLPSRLIKLFGDTAQNPILLHAVNQILSHAENHPLESLILHRLMQHLIVQDPVSKLKELLDDETVYTESSLNLVQRRLNEGANIETIAQEINGTRHNAYFEDMRVARKVVIWLAEVGPYLKSPELVANQASLLSQRIRQWVADHPDPFHINPLLGFFREFLGSDFFRGFEDKIHIIPEAEFKGALMRTGGVPESTDIMFVEAPQGNGTSSPEIWIREIPQKAENHSSTLETTMKNLLLGIIHEGDHFRHFSGNFEGAEQAGIPFRLAKIRREERLMTEVMAYVQELRWTNRNQGFTSWSLARRLGQPIPLMLRHSNDRGYFKKINGHLIAQFINS